MIDCSKAASEVASQIEDLFTSIFSRLSTLSNAVADEVSLARALDGTSSLRLGLIGVRLCDALRADPLAHTASYNAARGILSDTTLFSVVWSRDANGDLFDGSPSSDPAADSYYEYDDMDFFVATLQGKQDVVAGPYIDYGYDSAYTITFAKPTYIDNQFVGAVTLDVCHDAFEARLGGVILGADSLMVVANGDDRVVLSNDPAHPPGDLMHQGVPWRTRQCRGFEWRVFWNDSRPRDSRTRLNGRQR